MRGRLTTWTVWLRIVCAVALLSLGLAHRPPQLLAAMIETVALQLPDGSYADLCVGETARHHIPGVPAGACEACLINGQTCLPDPAGSAWLLTSFAAIDNPLRASRVVFGRQSTLRAQSRGPPSFS